MCLVIYRSVGACEYEGNPNYRTFLKLLAIFSWVYAALCALSSLEFWVWCTKHSMCTTITRLSCETTAHRKSFQLLRTANMTRHVSLTAVLFLLAIVVGCVWSASWNHTHSFHSLCDCVWEGLVHVWNTTLGRNIWQFWPCGVPLRNKGWVFFFFWQKLGLFIKKKKKNPGSWGWG